MSTRSWIDTFLTQESRWDWEYSTAEGFHTLGTQDDRTVVRIGVTADAGSGAYADGSLHETLATHDPVDLVVEFRAKLNLDLLAAGHGTAGLAAWNGSVLAPTLAWFWLASVESDAAFRGLRMQVVLNGSPTYNTPITGVDVTQWHVYRLHLTPTNILFYIDTVLQGSTSNVLDEAVRLEAWLDNASFVGGAQYPLDVDLEQILYLDWVNTYTVAHWTGDSAGDADNLLAGPLTAAAPVVATPTIGQIHTLAAADLTAAAPVPGTPTIGQIQALAPVDLYFAAWLFALPSLSAMPAARTAVPPAEHRTATPSAAPRVATP